MQIAIAVALLTYLEHKKRNDDDDKKKQPLTCPKAAIISLVINFTKERLKAAYHILQAKSSQDLTRTCLHQAATRL